MSVNIREISNRIRNNECNLFVLDFGTHPVSIEELKELRDAISTNTILANIKWGEIPTAREARSIIHGIETKLRENVVGYRYFPNPYEFGLLSNYTYYNAKVGELSESNNSGINLHLKNWSVHKVYRNDENGYYGALYYNNKTCQFVLAHRGTEFSGIKELFDHKDVSADISGIVLNKIVSQIFEAYKATEDSIKIAREHQLPLSFTGHSLGAWLAELSAYFSYKDLDYLFTRALTFDSPGSYDIFETLKSNIHGYHDRSYLEHLDIITYLSIPNLVNSCNGHVGEVFSVTPKVSEYDIQGNYFYSKTTLPLLTVLGHSLESIISEFNATTGLPNHYKQMLDWPCITCDYQEGQDHVAMAAGKKLGAAFSTFTKFVSLLKPINIPIYKVANLFVDFLNDKFNLIQYLRVINNEISFNKVNEDIEDNKEEREFYSKFEGHYVWKEPNPYVESIKGSKTTADWCLKQFYSAFAYLASPPEVCGLTRYEKNAIKFITVKYLYIPPEMHGRYQHGLLNSTESAIPVDSLKQAVARLNEVSYGALQKCIDLYERPSLWYGGVAERRDQKDVYSITEELVNNNIDLNAVDAEGNNLLYHAVANNQTKSADLLMSNGAKIIKNSNSRDAYDISLENHNINMANKLLQYIHKSSNAKIIELDQYGIYDGNDQDNIFVAKPDFQGKSEGYNIVIDRFDHNDKIDFSHFSGIQIDNLEFQVITFAGQHGIRITDRIFGDMVIVLNATKADVINNIAGVTSEESYEL